MESERIPKILNHAELEFMLADYGQNEICLENKIYLFCFQRIKGKWKNIPPQIIGITKSS